MKIIFAILLCACLCFGEYCTFSPVFTRNDNGGLFHVEFSAEAGVHIYESSIGVQGPDGIKVSLSDAQPPVIEDGEGVYRGKFIRVYYLEGNVAFPWKISITCQGCTETSCMLPLENEYSIDADGICTQIKDEKNSETVKTEKKADYRILSSRAGYMGVDDFLAWCDNAENGIKEEENLLSAILHRHGLWLVLLALLPLGALLNFTPCVLPMMPINLAIIGASGKGITKLQGLLRGSIYGLGMGIAYGALGIVVVLCGGQFGSINSTRWFNWTVAAVFVILALAMFDCFSIDFTRWRRTGKATSAAGIFLIGGMTALLAGACVAPVLIWTLLISAQIYSEGNSIGLIMPLILGLGMGLPWAVVGASVARLPRPGNWMVRLRQAFGVIIIAAACYYIYVGYRISDSGTSNAIHESWFSTFDEALNSESDYVFIDFTGPSCKACALMDANTFRNEKVVNRIEKWAKVSVRADIEKELASTFDVRGLPTCVLLKKGN